MCVHASSGMVSMNLPVEVHDPDSPQVNAQSSTGFIATPVFWLQVRGPANAAYVPVPYLSLKRCDGCQLCRHLHAFVWQ